MGASVRASTTIDDAMSGFIPIVLQTSFGGCERSAGPAPAEAGRRASLGLPLAPSPLIHRRQQSLPSLGSPYRGSLSPPAKLPNIPFTSSEWKNAIDEVKRKYTNRKYRTCSARCCEVLDNLKNPSAVEPLYLIYLHFYAASSFELCARPLSCSSNYRTRLLRDAQAHYKKAEALIQSTEESMIRRTRSASSSSTASSIPSPGLSSSSTTFSSRRTSVCSAEDGVEPKATSKPPVKAKKKVSFSGLNDLIEFQPEPYIRPDSPTLGWDDDILSQNSDDSFPMFRPVVYKPKRSRIIEPATVPGELPESPLGTTILPMPDNQQLANESSILDDRLDLDPFLQARSINRITAQLSALRSQVSWHRDGIEALLTAPDDTPATPKLPTDIPFHHQFPTPPHVGCADVLPSVPRSELLSSDKMDSYTLDSPKAIDRPASIRRSDDALQQRIERLRAGGWQRKRFDSRRYEALREQVLGELGA
ncbi:hypothetical protein GGR52DRAFT_329815 [Hypoxylon sp. FL1284]|nr:hypothetical protein GGR52DRAFT_329815 [Hypoxylon sp. FL1284]